MGDLQKEAIILPPESVETTLGQQAGVSFLGATMQGKRASQRRRNAPPPTSSAQRQPRISQHQEPPSLPAARGTAEMLVRQCGIISWAWVAGQGGPRGPTFHPCLGAGTGAADRRAAPCPADSRRGKLGESGAVDS